MQNIVKEKFDLPCPLLLTVFPCVKIIWLSKSCNSAFSSAIFVLLFLTIDATSDKERLSVDTSRSFSAPSFIWKRVLESQSSFFSGSVNRFQFLNWIGFQFESFLNECWSLKVCSIFQPFQSNFSLNAIKFQFSNVFV